MNLIDQLKQAGEDYEFYPTTNEILDRVIADVKELRNDLPYRGCYEERERRLLSILDIGAGNGKALRAFKDRGGFTDFYAIEKSLRLCQLIEPDVFIVGTDFMQQSLLSKAMDVVYCNPPYSEFKTWAVKIIRETAARVAFLVIPRRWQDDPEIAAALKYRGAEHKVLGEYSFEDAEDRQARAVVHVIRIIFDADKNDAFDRFFDEQFADLKAKFKRDAEREKDGELRDSERRAREASDNPKFRQLVPGADLPERMVALYNEELDHIRKNYDLVAQLDSDLLREFEVTPVKILKLLKERLASLRKTYWNELFNHMRQITDRLTSKHRREMMTTLQREGHVDFTISNIHAILLWVLKNANQHLDAQLIETFEAMVEKANVRNYVSNTRAWVDDRWRYNEWKPSHVALEYRMILAYCGGVEKLDCWDKHHNGLNERGCDFLQDLLTVARNLGFDCDTTDRRLTRWAHGQGKMWKSGDTQTFTTRETFEIGEQVAWGERTKKKIQNRVKLPDGCYQYLVDGEWYHQRSMPAVTLFEVRAFYNSNIHIRLNQKFALKLNVEYGRLKGWLKSGAEAATELNEPEAAQYFDCHVQLGVGSLPMLAAPAEPEVAAKPAGERIAGVQEEIALAV